MTKLDKLKQAEHLYVYEQQPLDVIGTKLDLSRRTLFYWKKEYEWDRKRFEKCREQKLFNRELLNFAQKIMDKISNDTKDLGSKGLYMIDTLTEKSNKTKKNQALY